MAHAFSVLVNFSSPWGSPGVVVAVPLVNLDWSAEQCGEGLGFEDLSFSSVGIYLAPAKQNNAVNFGNNVVEMMRDEHEANSRLRQPAKVST